MKKAELIALGISEEVAEQILALHGKGIEKFKGEVATVQQERDGFKTQLEASEAKIQEFTSMDIDGIKKAASDHKAEAEAAKAEAAKNISDLKFDHKLTEELVAAKVKNPKAVMALLKRDTLVHDEKEDKIVGLSEQLEAIKKSDDYLFSDGKEIRISTKITNPTSSTGDPVFDAARQAAGLPDAGAQK